MNKRKIISEAKEKSNYSKWEIDKITNAFLNSILEALERGEEVKLNNFGKFELKVRKARMVTHPKSKESKLIPKKVNVVFTVSKKFIAVR